MATGVDGQGPITGPRPTNTPAPLPSTRVGERRPSRNGDPSNECHRDEHVLVISYYQARGKYTSPPIP